MIERVLDLPSETSEQHVNFEGDNNEQEFNEFEIIANNKDD